MPNPPMNYPHFVKVLFIGERSQRAVSCQHVRDAIGGTLTAICYGAFRSEFNSVHVCLETCAQKAVATVYSTC
jgi:hypothetical protein